MLLNPLSGLIWIAEQIQERAAAELDEKENLSKRLLSLQLALDMGDLSEDEYDERENEILIKMKEVAQREKEDLAA
jgi:Gas vesicle protein G